MIQKPISILCWKWRANYKTTYTSDHVNIFAAMVRRNTTLPIKIYCITDDAAGVDLNLIDEVVPLWNEPEIDINNFNKPNCYRRLKMFSKQAEQMFGERIISMDIDSVIVSNIDHILNRTEDFIGWRKSRGSVHWQGSLTSIRAGSRAFIWDNFNGMESRIAASRFVGSDQAWVSHSLLESGTENAIYTPHDDGVYSYREHITKLYKLDKNGKVIPKLPENASIVFFHGTPKPFTAGMENLQWIRDHYRL
jgi:hypothetical protein